VTIIDARTMDGSGKMGADVCIIGAGAAGITLATRLASTFKNICLIESGGFEADEATQALCNLNSTGYPQRPDFMSRARYFGGSCNLWAGRNMALGPLDLQARDWVPHSGWPIAYDELARHYPEAEKVLRIPQLEALAGPWLRQNLTTAERSLLDDESLAATFSVWGKSSMRFGAAYRAELERSSAIQVLLNGSVTELNLNAAGSAVESVSVACLGGRRFTVRARQVILACGGLENARLLLASNSRIPSGIGNQHDLVGRFFMDHPRAVFGKVRFASEARLRLMRGRPLKAGKLQLGIGLSERAQREHRLLNHYVTFEAENSSYTQSQYQSFVQTMQVLLKRGRTGSRWRLTRQNLSTLPEMIYLLSPKELMPHPLYRLYVAARDALPSSPAPKTFVAVYFCEQPPDPQSRVLLSQETDSLGVRRLTLNWKIGDSIVDSMRRIQDILGSRLQQAGLGVLEQSDAEIKFTDASHHMGTTRMADDPRRGVVDRNCAVFGVPNLHVAGSSVFPTAGHANPTLTIVAMCLRLAQHLQSAGA
jgi:choline dehydrogenase-like flavoprotein